MSDGTGPGKRLTGEQEQRGAELYAAGASERDVAEALGCSASTAHRLRERLAREAAPAAPTGTEPAGPDTPEATVTSESVGAAEALPAPQPGQGSAPGPDSWELTALLPDTDVDAELAELETHRAELERIAGVHEERAEVSRSAVASLEAERLALLDAGKDAAPLRSRMASAQADAADAADTARLVRERLAPVGARIAELQARQDLAAVRGQLEAAVAERDAICSRTGERMRAAVLASSAAPAELVQALADDQAARRQVEQLAAAVAARARLLGEPEPVVPPVVSTALQCPAGVPEPLPFSQMLWRAAQGDVAGCAMSLAENLGWLPPDPAEVEAQRERLIAMRAAEAAPAAPGIPVQIPEHWGASVSVDQHGIPLAPPDPERPRPEQVPAAGWLGGQPWPG